MSTHDPNPSVDEGTTTGAPTALLTRALSGAFLAGRAAASGISRVAVVLEAATRIAGATIRTLTSPVEVVARAVRPRVRGCERRRVRRRHTRGCARRARRRGPWRCVSDCRSFGPVDRTTRSCVHREATLADPRAQRDRRLSGDLDRTTGGGGRAARAHDRGSRLPVGGIDDRRLRHLLGCTPRRRRFGSVRARSGPSRRWWSLGVRTRAAVALDRPCRSVLGPPHTCGV